MHVLYRKKIQHSGISIKGLSSMPAYGLYAAICRRKSVLRGQFPAYKHSDICSRAGFKSSINLHSNSASLLTYYSFFSANYKYPLVDKKFIWNRFFMPKGIPRAHLPLKMIIMNTIEFLKDIDGITAERPKSICSSRGRKKMNKWK